MKTAHYIAERGIIKIKFPYQREMISKMLNLGATSRMDDIWELPFTEKNMTTLKDMGFELSRSATKVFHQKITKDLMGNTPHALYPYQLEGVNEIASRNGRALLADEMGLGKTIQALCYLKVNSNNLPALIICPSNLKINWQRETEKWIPNSKITVLEGTTPYAISKTLDVLIINYDILHGWLEKIKGIAFSTLIIDEGHYIKNSTSKRTKAVKRIAKGISKLIAITGTPIETRPMEIYNLIQLVNPELFPNYIYFGTRYCNGKKGYFGWDFNGSSHTAELHEILKTIMIRRKKKDVLKDLPPKQIVKIPLEINNRSAYNKAEAEFIAFLKEKFSVHTEDVKEELKRFAKNNKIETGEELTSYDIETLKAEKLRKASIVPALAQIEVLKQLAIAGKMEQIIEWVKNFLESGEKLVLFCVHRSVVSKLMESFPDAVKVDGSISNAQRQDAVDKFQNDPNCKLFIGNIRAAGVGLTLTAASNAGILEFPWNPAVLSQAEDRIHRITQLKQVTIWRFTATNTIEEKIVDLLKERTQMSSRILDGKVEEDSSIIMSLLESYIK